MNLVPRWGVPVLLGVLVLSTPGAARADAIGILCQGSKAGGYLVEALRMPRGGACTGFVVRDARGRQVSRAENVFFGSGRLLLSPDGRRVVFVQDYFYGMLTKGSIIAYGRRPPRLAPTADALVFFRDGKKLASYDLAQLLVRVRLVELSMSHIGWISNWQAMRQPLGKTLELVTTSYRRYRFDTTTGKRLSAVDTGAWTRCRTMAYGKLWHSKHGWEISPAYRVKGTVPARVWPLALRPGKGPEPNSYRVLCLERRKADWLLVEVLRGMLNGASATR